MKTGLVLEGGAMRGVFTAGVLDVFMENDISFDGIIGVSAGALFGVNFLSEQNGRVIRYCKKYNKDKDYMGTRHFLKTGDFINPEYAYGTVPFKLDVFDDETYKESDVPFYAIMTNIETGEPEYVQITSVFEQMDYLRASGSMPFLSKPVEINNNLYLDGAVTDSIPYDFMLKKGYDSLVVILTKPENYVKKPLPKLMTNIMYKKNYPKFAKKVRDRHKMYNAQMNRLKDLEKRGIVKVIRPTQQLEVSRTEKDPEKLQDLYMHGRSEGEKFLKLK